MKTIINNLNAIMNVETIKLFRKLENISNEFHRKKKYSVHVLFISLLFMLYAKIEQMKTFFPFECNLSINPNVQWIIEFLWWQLIGQRLISITLFFKCRMQLIPKCLENLLFGSVTLILMPNNGETRIQRRQSISW